MGFGSFLMVYVLHSAFSSLNVAIGALDLAKDTSGIASAKVGFDAVSALLTTIRMRFERDNIKLGLSWTISISPCARR